MDKGVPSGTEQCQVMQQRAKRPHCDTPQMNIICYLALHWIQSSPFQDNWKDQLRVLDIHQMIILKCTLKK